MTEVRRPRSDVRDPTSEGRRPRFDRITKRLLILWFAVAFVVWNGVYDMRMHDTVLRYLLDASMAQGHATLDLRTYLHRGLVDAIAFSTAWALGVLLAGLMTIRTFRQG